MIELSKIENRLRSLVADCYPVETEPGCSVLVLQADESIYITFGRANLDTGQAIRPETNFRLASVAKQFTAACILQLRDNQQLQLNQVITDFFPDFPAYGKSLTVEHLLRHTSGLKDYEPLVATQDFVDPVMDREVLEILSQQSNGDFDPGSKFRYSNSGYAVLAQIVKKVSGLTFPEYLIKNIFHPFDMANSVAFVNRAGSPAVPHRAIGYALQAEGFVWNDQGSTTAVLGDGGIYTSILEYEKWIRAYMGGKILSSQTVIEAWTPTLTTSGETVPYGYGWRLEQIEDKWRPYHPGGTSGFRNGVVVDPERHTVVLVLTNRSNGDSVALAKALEAELLMS